MSGRCAVLAATVLLSLAAGCRPPVAKAPHRPEAGLELEPAQVSTPALDAAAGPAERDGAAAGPGAADAGDKGGLELYPDGAAGILPAIPDAAAGFEDAGPPLAGPETDAGWLAPELIVAVGNDGRRLLSNDGKVWFGDMRETTGNRDGPRALRAVAYGEQTVVAVGGGCAPTCTSRIVTFDGRSWHEADASEGKGRLNAVAYGDGVWVAVGSTPPILRSTDGGRTWTPAGKIAVPEGLRAVAHGNVGGRPLFVAVGDGYTRVSSPDGLAWTNLHEADGTTEAFRAVAIGNDVAVAVGGRTGAGKRMRSIDGVTWTDVLTGGPDLFSAVFIDGQFLAFSAAGDDTLHASADGKSWLTQITSNAGSNVAAGTFLGKRFFVSRVSPGSIRISIDGYVWAQTPVMSMRGDSVINAFTIAGN